jgi:hypothetical protein
MGSGWVDDWARLRFWTWQVVATIGRAWCFLGLGFLLID